MLFYVTIYKLIRKDKREGGELYKYLRNSEEVGLKQRISDFEIDLIIGKNHKGAQLTIVDRATSFTLL